jgi:radical SAM protein with 4Fe4S-binding SPASM domain
MAYDVPIEARAEGGLPIQALLLVSDHCNHACVHCYQVHGQKGEMTLAQIEGVLDELARVGVLFLWLSGGEATLRPDLPAILRAARARDFAIGLRTNGYAVSDDLLDELVRVGIWRVMVSIYSDMADEHDRVTLVPGSFERTVGTIRRLRARGVNVSIAVPLTSHTSADAPRLHALAASLDADLEIDTLITAKEDGSLVTLASNPRRDQLVDYFRQPGHAPVPSREVKLDEAPCGACSHSLTVHANGSVRPCTHIPVELSTAGAGAIAEVAKSDAFRLVAGVRWRDLHGCRDCALVRYCGRCHGSAAFETGDMFGPHPSGCRSAIVRYEALEGPIERGAPTHELGRPHDVGPFAVVTMGPNPASLREERPRRVLRPIPDVVSGDDADRAFRFPWIRPSTDDLRELAGLVPVKNLVRRHQPTQNSGKMAPLEGVRPVMERSSAE